MEDFSDYRWLTGCEAETRLAQLASDDRPLHQQIETLRRDYGPERARLLALTRFVTLQQVI